MRSHLQITLASFPVAYRWLSHLTLGYSTFILHSRFPQTPHSPKKILASYIFKTSRSDDSSPAQTPSQPPFHPPLPSLHKSSCSSFPPKSPQDELSERIQASSFVSRHLALEGARFLPPAHSGSPAVCRFGERALGKQ